MATSAKRGSDDQLASIVHHNIRALVEMNAAAGRSTPAAVKVADAITRFTGSIRSVFLHALLFGGWLSINAGVVPGIEPFDPFPFVMLAMFASVEAIFLTTFVLVSQNRISELSERRAELELQINLLAEHEVTRLLQMVEAIADRVGAARPEVDDLKREVRPEQVLDALDAAMAKGEAAVKGRPTTPDDARAGDRRAPPVP